MHELPDSGGHSASLEQAIATFGAHQQAIAKEVNAHSGQICELRKELSLLRDRVAALENTSSSHTIGSRERGARLGQLEQAFAALSEVVRENAWRTEQVVLVSLKKLESRDEAQAVQIETVNSWMKGVIMVGSALVLLVTLRGPIGDLLKSNAPRFSPPADAAGENYNPLQQYPD